MTKEELARWMKDMRDQTIAEIRAEHRKTRGVTWNAASRIADIVEALIGKRIAGRDEYRADPAPTVE
jgi:hypothetical protein